MNIISRIGIGCMVLVLFIPGFVAFAHGMDEPGFSINRMEVSRNIEDREPVASGEIFSAATEKLYCYLDARNIEQDTTISFVWYYENREMARVEFPLQKGRRWRTWSSKKINGLKGTWKVELRDSAGIIRNSVNFTVE